MKISLLIHELIAPGGAQRQILWLGRWLAAFGHDVTVYTYWHCPEGCYPELAASLDIRAVERISAAQTRQRSRRRRHAILPGAKRHLWESQRLAKLIANPGDILNPHVRGATRAAVECKRRTGTPVVWMCDDARNWEEPGYRIYYSPPVQWVFDRIMGLLERSVVKKIDRIAVLDHRVKRILETHYGRPASVVHSGLETSGFTERPEARQRIRERYGIFPSDFLLLWLGIIEPHRHLEDAIAGLAQVVRQRPNVRFLIAGAAASPCYARALAEQAERNGLASCVRFDLRSVPEIEMAEYYSAANALVYLAENQCWGLGVFEAISCNLPVIVSRACGAHEVLEDRQTAMLVPPRDPDAFCRAVTELVDDPLFCRRLAERSHAEVLPKISWERYARSMVAVYEQVLSGGQQTVEPLRKEAFA